MSMVVDFMFRENILNEMLNPETDAQHLSIRYILFYIVSLLWNALMLSLYTVQVFTEHKDCYADNAVNILYDIQLSFHVGFGILLLDTIICNVVSIYVRFKVDKES